MVWIHVTKPGVGQAGWTSLSCFPHQPKRFVWRRVAFHSLRWLFLHPLQRRDPRLGYYICLYRVIGQSRQLWLHAFWALWSALQLVLSPPPVWSGRWHAGAQQHWPAQAKQSLCFASLLALNTQYFGHRGRLGLRMRCRVRMLGMQPAHRRWCQQIYSSGWKNCAGKPLWCSSSKPADHPLSWHELSMHNDVLTQGAAFSHSTLAPPCWKSPS